MQRGRRSSAANIVPLTITTPRPKLTPPTPLSSAEKLIFIATAAQHPHLTAGDTVLLVAFAQAAVRTFKLSKSKNTDEWEKSLRALLSVATKLRLTPQSTHDPQTLGRQRRNLPRGPAPWKVEEE